MPNPHPHSKNSINFDDNTISHLTITFMMENRSIDPSCIYERQEFIKKCYNLNCDECVEYMYLLTIGVKTRDAMNRIDAASIDATIYRFDQNNRSFSL